MAALAVLAFAPPGAAQSRDAGTISGRVVDARTGAGLEKVSVVVEGANVAATTDGNGSFTLAGVPAGERRLAVSTVGYIFVRREVTVVGGQALELVIPLSEGTGTYTETVTVAADRFRPAETAVAAQQVLGSADIQSLRGVLADDPLRAVQVLPGVTTGDDLRSEFSVRGSGFNRINMTVDGFPTPYLLHTVRAVEDYSGSGSVAMINSDILEDVTLLNGGYPQRFGNRTGAEMDFRLREGSRKRFQARAAVSGTSASTVLEGPLGGRASWIFSARQSYLDLLVEHLVEEGLHFQFTDAQSKFVIDASPTQRFEVALVAGRSRLEQTRDDPDADYLQVGRNASGVAIGTWRTIFSRAAVTTRVLGAVNTFKNDTASGASLDRGEDRQAAARTDAVMTLGRGIDLEAGAQADWTGETRTRHRFSSAINAYRVINDYEGDATRSGGYADLRVTRSRFTLVPGARFDHWTLTGETTASPWAQAEWRLSSSFTARGGAGVYRQFPDFEQVIGTLGTPGATAERARQYDLGIEQRVGDAARWQITVYDREENGFFRRIGSETRLVNGRVVRGISTSPYRASLDGYARGVELLVQRKSPNGLAGWVAYSYGRNRYRDRITRETFWGDQDQRHTLNLYVFYRKSDRASFSAKLRAGSNIPAPGYFTERNGSYFVSDTRNDVRLPYYSRIDLRANRTYAWSSRRLTLFAEVMNVLNRDNVRFNPPGTNARTGAVGNPFEKMIPIVPSVGILIEF